MKTMKDTTFYRVNEAPRFMGSDPFSKPGDTIAIIERIDTDMVVNLTTGMRYTYGGEQGTIIPNIDEHPLYESEKENLKALRGW
jgi:hypothetical protein